jgi:hypothetical protein
MNCQQFMCVECTRALESCHECFAISVLYREAVSALGDVNRRARYRSDHLSWLEEAKQTVQLACRGRVWQSRNGLM